MASLSVGTRNEPVANATVMGPRRLVRVAERAELIEGLLLLLRVFQDRGQGGGGG